MTTDQLSLPGLAPLVTPERAPDATIQEKFEAWSAANPWVMSTVERLLADWFAAGHKRGSLKQVWEVIRYHYGTTTGDRFKANNNYTSRAARAVLARHPEWVGRIELRELKAL